MHYEDDARVGPADQQLTKGAGALLLSEGLVGARTALSRRLGLNHDHDHEYDSIMIILFLLLCSCYDQIMIRL